MMVPLLIASAVDAVAPTLDNITINDATPNNVVMRFSDSVNGTNLGFTLAGTTSTTFTSLSGSGANWTGILASPAAELETITLSYEEATGDFEDLSGNALADITNQSVIYTFSGTDDGFVKSMVSKLMISKLIGKLS